MNPHPERTPAAAPDSVPALVGCVYAEAPIPLKTRLLEHLLKPLGLLSLVTVCNGAFSILALNRDWSRMGIRPEMARSVNAEQVKTLTGYVQQVSVESITSLTQVLTTSPVLQGSVAASALIALLIRHACEQPKPSQRDLEDFAP